MYTARFTFNNDLKIDAIQTNIINMFTTFEADQTLIADVLKMFPDDAVKLQNTLILAREKGLVSTYRSLTDDVINHYKLINYDNTIFGVERCKDIHRRVGIIINFLIITNDFIPIRWETMYNVSSICRVCMGKCKVYKTFVRCRECGFIDEYHTSNVKIKDSKFETESTYNAPKNFRKEISFISGVLVKHTNINEVVKTIRNHLHRSMVFDIKRNDIRYALKACHYNNYSDVNYMYHAITRKGLPKLYIYSDRLVERFTKYYQVFSSMDDKEGSNVNNNFLLRLFMQQEGLEYEDDWFKSVSDSTRNKHIRNAVKVCKHLADDPMGWPYDPSWDTI